MTLKKSKDQELKDLVQNSLRCSDGYLNKKHWLSMTRGVMYLSMVIIAMVHIFLKLG